VNKKSKEALKSDYKLGFVGLDSSADTFAEIFFFFSQTDIAMLCYLLFSVPACDLYWLEISAGWCSLGITLGDLQLHSAHSQAT